MTATDQQVRLLRMSYSKSGCLEKAAAKAGMCRQTGKKYLDSNELPSSLKKDHEWRTRSNPFEEVWDEAVEILEAAPEIQGEPFGRWSSELPELEPPSMSDFVGKFSSR